jgi:hypothetical protein
MKRAFAFLFFWCAAVGATAAPLERDLGNGLAYVRVHVLPADLPTKAPTRPAASVLDVRFVSTDAEGATALSAWLNFRATAKAPVFLLANSETAPALLEALEKHERGAVVVIGIEAGAFRPDVAVKATRDDERRAYDALEKGAAIVTLLTDNPNKVRNDEASLSKDRLAEASADATDAALVGKAPVVPIDATMQRAVHLHRALLALKRL